MKSIITAGLLSASLAISLVLPSQAMDVGLVSNNISRSRYSSVQPVDLVYLGYQGYFQEQGIASYGGFVNGINSGKINAEKLVEVAIATGRLPQDTLSDQGYLWKVQSQLDKFDVD